MRNDPRANAPVYTPSALAEIAHKEIATREEEAKRLNARLDVLTEEIRQYTLIAEAVELDE